MFKALIENLKSTKAQARSPIFSLLLLASLCIFSPLMAYNVHAATNPEGTTINGGMQATAADPILNNYGTILGGYVVSADERAGMYGDDTTNFNFSNFGTIDVWFDNAGGDAYAYGMYVDDDGNHTLTNSGTIIARATSTGDEAYAYGMHVDGDGNHTLTNSGTITVRATTSTTHTTIVSGMSASGNGSHTLTNSGTITATGTSPAGGGALVSGMLAGSDGNHTLTNSGTITATATSHGGTARAFGMHIIGTPAAGTEHLVSNTGIINTYATGARTRTFEAYGNNSYSVGTWATTLRTWTNTDAVFAAAAGQTVRFNNSKFILRPGTSAQGFVLGKDYAVASMVSINGASPATISGSISEVVAEVPFLKASMSGPANAPLVRLESNVSEDTTPGAATMQQAVAQAQGQFNNLSTSLRNALVNIYTEANLVADAEQNNTSVLPQVQISPLAINGRYF